MDNDKPLLSICIPTYNRAEYLDKSLASIVRQNEFNSELVEIVISDNASIDNTEEIVEKYKKQYNNIYYSKNNENIKDKNFPIVIGNAHGIFRKLCNDTAIFERDSIQHMLNTIIKNKSKKPVLFFMDFRNKRRKKMYFVDNYDTFMKFVSFWSTWICSFGIWEDDYEKLNDKFDGCSLSLWQTKVLFETIAQKKKCVIDNRKLFVIQGVVKKNMSYGIYDIFYINYLNLCQQYVSLQILSKKTFEYLRKHLLLVFFCNWLAELNLFSSKYKLSSNKSENKIMVSYQKDSYYILFVIKLWARIFWLYIKIKIIRPVFIAFRLLLLGR